MKKIFFVIFMLLSIFAYSNEYIVEKINGNVSCETIDGSKALSVGQIVQDSTVVNIGLNSSLIIKSENKSITISAMKNGMIINLIPKITINGKIITSNSTVSQKVTGNISTASTRASESTNDVEWVE